LSDLVYIPNRVSSPITGKKLYENLNYVTNKFLNHDIEFIGSITEDPIYSRAWQADNPASIISKNTNASAEINKIAREIENHQVFNTPNNNSLQFFLTGIQVN
jgi:MinD-like ATPase involved in chromosome partitioning or flagellar assembly